MNDWNSLAPPPPVRFQERRRLTRGQVNIGASLGGSIVRRMHVDVCDISGIGCRIAARCRFNPGDFLTLSIPSFGPLGGSVIWAQEHCIGFEFARPLHPAVVRTIRATSRPRTATRNDAWQMTG